MCFSKEKNISLLQNKLTVTHCLYEKLIVYQGKYSIKMFLIIEDEGMSILYGICWVYNCACGHQGKYVLLRDLAGAAVASADAEDWLSKCNNSSGPALLSTLKHTFTEVARQPRAAQLLSLQDQLHEAGHFSYSGRNH